MLHGSYIGALARAMYENEYHGFALQVGTSGFLDEIRQHLFTTGDTEDFKSLYGDDVLDAALLSFHYDLINEFQNFNSQNPPPEKADDMDDDEFDRQLTAYNQGQKKCLKSI